MNCKFEFYDKSFVIEIYYAAGNDNKTDIALKTKKNVRKISNMQTTIVARTENFATHLLNC